MRPHLPAPFIAAGVAAAFASFASLASPRLARADETEGERLFREGRALLLEGRFDDACPKLAESQRLEPHVGTLLNLAACHEKAGKIATAWVEYQQALTAAQAEAGHEEQQRLARTRIEALDPRIPWLTVIVRVEGQSEDTRVTLDGGALPLPSWSKAMPVDPGGHEVRATATGRKAFEDRFDLAEGEHRTVAVVLEPEPPATPVPPVTATGADHQASGPAAGPLPAPPAEARSRWVFEGGLFVGYLAGSSARPSLAVDPASVQLRDAQGRPSSCAVGGGCTYGVFDGNHTPVIGVDLFGGYALSESATLGGRLIGGAGLDRGGTLLLVGPSLSLHVTRALSIGASLWLGEATVDANGVVNPPPGSSNDGSYPLVDATPGTAAGAGIDLELRLARLPRGALVLDSRPLFLFVSGGSAWCLPLGLAYRFE